MNRRNFTSSTLAGLLAGALSRISLAQDSTSSTVPARKTGFHTDESYLNKEINKGKPETPARLQAILREMATTGLDKRVTRLDGIANPRTHIRRIHTDAHIAAIRSIPVTGAIAEKAVAGVLVAVKAVHEGSVRNAFCAIRPPGHHAANTRREEGFCYYNNIAVAARYAQELGHKKILIIDWDYHHGNGTEAAFYEDPTVLYFSTHDERAYPGTGSASRRGAGAGLGFNINVPLPCRTGDREMVAAWENHLMPVVKTFAPDFVLISAGFDSRVDDPLGCFDVTDIGYVTLTKMAMSIADTHAQGRLVSALEGGYNPEGLAKAACAHIRALSGDV